MTEQPGLFLNEEKNLVSLTLGGHTDLCLLDIGGVEELLSRLGAVYSEMRKKERN